MKTRTQKIEALHAVKAWLATTHEIRSGVWGALGLATDSDWMQWREFAKEISEAPRVERWELFRKAEECLKRLTSEAVQEG